MERLTETVTYRCTEQAKADLQRAAHDRGMSPSLFAEKAVNEKVRRTLKVRNKYVDHVKWGLSKLKEQS